MWLHRRCGLGLLKHLVNHVLHRPADIKRASALLQNLGKQRCRVRRRGDDTSRSRHQANHRTRKLRKRHLGRVFIRLDRRISLNVNAERAQRIIAEKGLHLIPRRLAHKLQHFRRWSKTGRHRQTLLLCLLNQRHDLLNLLLFSRREQFHVRHGLQRINAEMLRDNLSLQPNGVTAEPLQIALTVTNPQRTPLTLQPLSRCRLVRIALAPDDVRQASDLVNVVQDLRAGLIAALQHLNDHIDRHPLDQTTNAALLFPKVERINRD